MCFHYAHDYGIIMVFINWHKVLMNLLQYMATFCNNGNFIVT